MNELETEGRLAIESPTTPITVAPDTFNLGKWWNIVWFSIYKLYTNNVHAHVQTCTCSSGVSLRIEVAGGYYKMTGESGHSEKKLTSSVKIPCSSRRILRSPMLNGHPGTCT